MTTNEHSPEFEEQTYAKVSRRLLPFLFLCYILAYLDRVNLAIRLYNQLAEVVYGEAEPLLEPSQWITGGAAFRMAQKSGLDLSLRQKMLEMLSEDERLSFLHNYLTELVPKVKEYETMQALSRNDGYLRQGP